MTLTNGLLNAARERRRCCCNRAYGKRERMKTERRKRTIFIVQICSTVQTSFVWVKHSAEAYKAQCRLDPLKNAWHKNASNIKKKLKDIFTIRFYILFFALLFCFNLTIYSFIFSLSIWSCFTYSDLVLYVCTLLKWSRYCASVRFFVTFENDETSTNYQLLSIMLNNVGTLISIYSWNAW